jgi:hypothetical protein
MHAACSTYLTLLNITTLRKSDEMYKFWKILSSETWRRGDWLKFNDVFEEATASIFRVEEQGEEWRTLLLSCLTYPPALMMEAVCFSEILVNYQTTRYHIPENSTLRSHRREVITSDINYKHTELLGFWTLSIVWYSREHDVSETVSVSVLRWRWGRRHLLSWAP